MQLFMIHLPTQLSDPQTLDTLLSHLDTPAQDRIRRYRLPADALRSAVGRLAPVWYLRTRDLLPLTATPRFGTTPQGKPVLLSPPLTLAFNTSHDGAYVLFGVEPTTSGTIGVDIMQHPQDVAEVEQGISDQLTCAEKAALAREVDTVKRRELVTALWTLKEAYVKATGDGIGFGLDRIEVELDSHGQAQGVRVDGRDITADGWKWALGTVPGPNGTYGWSVCWRGDDWSGQLQHVDWSQFTQQFLTRGP